MATVIEPVVTWNLLDSASTMKNIAETFTPGKATCNFQLIRLTIATLIERLVVGNALISAVIRQKGQE